jgi:hypothetical protein
LILRDSVLLHNTMACCEVEMKNKASIMLAVAALVIMVISCGPTVQTPTPEPQTDPTPTPFTVPDSGPTPSNLPDDPDLLDLINYSIAIAPLLQRVGEIVARDGEVLKEAEGGNDAALCDGRLAADNLEMQGVMGEIAAILPPTGMGDIHLLLLESSTSYTEALDNVALFCSTNNNMYKLGALLKFWEAAVQFQTAANQFWQLLVSEGVEVWVP